MTIWPRDKTTKRESVGEKVGSSKVELPRKSACSVVGEEIFKKSDWIKTFLAPCQKKNRIFGNICIFLRLTRAEPHGARGDRVCQDIPIQRFDIGR